MEILKININNNIAWEGENKKNVRKLQETG